MGAPKFCVKTGDRKSFLINVEIHKFGCWLWLGGKNGYGYGEYHLNGKRVSAHRYSYEKYVGKIPLGLEVDHLCRIRNCINPIHLELVTKSENVKRERVVSSYRPTRRDR